MSLVGAIHRRNKICVKSLIVRDIPKPYDSIGKLGAATVNRRVAGSSPAPEEPFFQQLTDNESCAESSRCLFEPISCGFFVSNETHPDASVSGDRFTAHFLAIGDTLGVADSL